MLGRFNMHCLLNQCLNCVVVSCRRQAHLCALAANCDEPMYVKLVEALCAEHQINLIKVNKLEQDGFMSPALLLHH